MVSAALLLLLLLTEPPKQGNNHDPNLMHLYNVHGFDCFADKYIKIKLPIFSEHVFTCLFSPVGSEAFPVSCCLKLCDIKVRKELLKNYSLQDKPLCPVKAVR